MKTAGTILLLAVVPFLTVAKRPVNHEPVFLDAYDNVHGGKAPYNQKSVNANGNRFWLLKGTTKVPCDRFGICVPGKQAVFLAPQPADLSGNDFLKNENATFYLNSELPIGGPGQQVYIAKDGAFSFTNPNDRLPAGSISTGFQGGDFGMFQVLDPDHSGATIQSYACKEGDSYGIYYYRNNKKKIPKNCTSFTMQFGGGIYGAKRYI